MDGQIDFHLVSLKKGADDLARAMGALVNARTNLSVAHAETWAEQVEDVRELLEDIERQARDYAVKYSA